MFCSRADTSVPSTQIQVISSTRAMAAGIRIQALSPASIRPSLPSSSPKP